MALDQIDLGQRVEAERLGLEEYNQVLDFWGPLGTIVRIFTLSAVIVPVAALRARWIRTTFGQLGARRDVIPMASRVSRRQSA